MNFRETWKRIRCKGARHWFGVLTALLVGLFVSHRLQEEPSWQRVRYWGHQFFERLPDDHDSAGRTVVVMIDDAEYASDKLKGSSPLDREYLATLVATIRDAAPHVIGLDVALTQPKGLDPFPKKTKKLRETIESVPKTTKVVLTFRVAADKRGYVREAGLLDEIRRSNVAFGCVTLTRDKARLGLQVPLVTGAAIDTFATALARAADPEAVALRAKKGRDHSLVATFLKQEQIDVVRAADLRMRNADALAKLAHKIVIVGGSWTDSATGRQIDLHKAADGNEWPGAVLHANYVEALLASGATKRPMSGRFNVVMEVLATLAVALIFALALTNVIRAVLFSLVAVVIVLLSIAIYQNFGGFFDATTVLLFLGVHAWIERGDKSRSHAVRRWSFGLTVIACVMSTYLLYRQSKEPVATYDIEDVAQVAKLTVEPYARDLEALPALPEFDPTVQLAQQPTAVPMPRGGPVASPFPAPAPQEVVADEKIQQFVPDRILHIAGHGVVQPVRTPVTNPPLPNGPSLADVQFKKAMEKWKASIPPTPPEKQLVTPTQENTQTAQLTIPQPPTGFPGPMTDSTSGADIASYAVSRESVAREAFDDAWNESRLRILDAQDEPRFEREREPTWFRRPRLTPVPKAIGSDFEVMCERLVKSAHALAPQCDSDGFVLTLHLPVGSFASDEMIERRALDALAAVAVELMKDKDLSVTVVSNPLGERSLQRRNAVFAALRDMRVENRRITSSDDASVGPEEVQVRVWL